MLFHIHLHFSDISFCNDSHTSAVGGWESSLVVHYTQNGLYFLFVSRAAFVLVCTTSLFPVALSGYYLPKEWYVGAPEKALIFTYFYVFLLEDLHYPDSQSCHGPCCQYHILQLEYHLLCQTSLVSLWIYHQFSSGTCHLLVLPQGVVWWACTCKIDFQMHLTKQNF